MSKLELLQHYHANHLRELELIDRAFHYGTLMSAGLLVCSGALLLIARW